MIEITKDSRGKYYCMECPECDCRFKYQLEDTRLKNIFDIDRFIECPVCHKPIPHLYRIKDSKNQSLREDIKND